jgi:reductive dehalogenase
MIAAAPAGSTVMESGLQYLNTGSIAMQLASFLRSLGYKSLAHIDGRYEVIAPIVAKDAGLGELGRMGLLMTPSLGPRVRIGVVTTNASLIIDKPTFAPDVIDFCRICKKCADCCPGKAISHTDRENINGDTRWQIDQEECFRYWTVCGTDCGRCMSVCPYSHPNNILHNIVRNGLKNSALFRRFALKMDDFLYGRKPVPGDLPKWISKHS